MSNVAFSALRIDSWQASPSNAEVRILRFFPCLTDFAFAIPAVLLLVLIPEGASRLLMDGDTGWHIRTGEWILQHHAVPRVDVFSFTKAGQPWFAWEWGWDVLAALIHHATGLPGLLFANFAVLCLVSSLLFRLARKVSGHDLFAIVFATAAMLVSMIHWLARPHLLSWLFVLVFLHTLWDAEHGQVRRLVLLPILVLLWTNIHPSFFIALILVSLAAAGQLASNGWHASRPFWICSAVCAATTFANPYGWHVHAHILSYLGNAGLMDRIQEFQSLNFHYFPAIFFEGLLLPLGAVIGWCIRGKRWAAAAAIVLFAHCALVSARNIPVFLFLAIPYTAGWFADLAVAARRKQVLSRLVTAISEVNAQLEPFERVGRVYAASALLLLFCAVSFATNQNRPEANPAFAARFPKSFPSQVLPIVERAGTAHVFTTDQWGDFFIYRLFPSATVFVDGRSDFFGPEFIERCRDILQARWDWEQKLLEFSTDMVIVPPQMPVTTVLKASPHWKLLFDDGSVVVFARNGRTGTEDRRISAVARNGRKELGSLLVSKQTT